MRDGGVANLPQLVIRVDATTVLMRHKVFIRNCWNRCSRDDRAVVLENLWWKIIDFAALWQSSVTFLNNDQEPETAISRWARARIRAAKVGKGLSTDEKAKKLLSFKYWLEAIDPLHRYGNNLHKYYVAWNNSQSPQPFFFWLDFGDGKEITVDQCSRTDLRAQRVKYLGPEEREEYEVIVDSGRLVYRRSGSPLDTPEDTKWIFVVSTSRQLYVGRKKTGWFQHSSFLAGGAIVAAGRVVASSGVLQAIWRCSGHYRPTEESFMEIMSFLHQNHVNMSLVKTFPTDGSFAPASRNVTCSSSHFAMDTQPNSECP